MYQNFQYQDYAAYLKELQVSINLQIQLFRWDRFIDLKEETMSNHQIVLLYSAFIALFAGCTPMINIDVLIEKENHTWPQVRAILKSSETMHELVKIFFKMNISQKFTYANYHKSKSLLALLDRSQFDANHNLLCEFLMNASTYINLYDQEFANNSFKQQKEKYSKIFQQWQSFEEEYPQKLNIQPQTKVTKCKQYRGQVSSPAQLRVTASTSKLDSSSNKINSSSYSASKQQQDSDKKRSCTPKRKVCFHDETQKSRQIQRKINVLEQQIQKLQQQKTLLEWDAIREVKQVQNFRQKQIEKKEIDWSQQQRSQENLLKEKKIIQEKTVERDMSLERKEFYRSQRSLRDSSTKLLKDISLQNLKSQLNSTLRRKEIIEGDIQRTKQSIERYPSISPFKEFLLESSFYAKNG